MFVLNAQVVNGSKAAGQPAVFEGLAYADALATAEPTVIRARIITGTPAVMQPTADASCAEPDVFIMPPPRTMNARAQVYVDESGIERIRARIVWARGSAVGRSEARAIGMAKLAEGTLAAESEISVDPAKIRRFRYAHGEAVPDAEASADAYVVRGFEAEVSSSADFYYAPTIERTDEDGTRTRYSYNFGTLDAESSIEGSAKREVRGFATATAEAEAEANMVVYRRMSAEVMSATAEVETVAEGLFVSHWHWAEGTLTAESEVIADGVAGRKSGGILSASASAEAVASVHRYMGGEIHAQADISLVPHFIRSGAGEIVASASVECMNKVYRPAGGEIEASAQFIGQGVRLVYMYAQPLEGSATIPPVRPVTNDATPPPISRRIYVQAEDRTIDVPAENREIRIT